MIALIDYGAGNLTSVRKALSALAAAGVDTSAVRPLPEASTGVALIEVYEVP